MVHYDLIIKNSEIHDGSGQPSFPADIAIKDGVIAAIGDSLDGTADKQINAQQNIDAPDSGISSGPDFWRDQLKRIDQAQSEGLDIKGQVISRPVGILMRHPASMSPYYQRPTFLSLQHLHWDERMAQLGDPTIKAKILAEENQNPHIFVQLLNDKFSIMYPMEDPIEYLPAREDSVAARAQRQGKDPNEWLYDFLLGNDGTNLVYIPAANANTEAIPQLLAHQHTVAALGDGGAHVGSICDASANIYLLTKWVREKKVFDLAQGINMLTRQPGKLIRGQQGDPRVTK